MQYPKISIVTPSYNQGQFIEETITSVLNQQYPNLEYIIIDGGSTDNSVEIIKKYESHLKYWISEKDSGQANAINKGLTHCTGEIFNWLNSDDYLEKDALRKIASSFELGADMVAGSVRLFKDHSTVELVKHRHLSAKGLMYWLPDVKFVQPGVWMKRELVANCGGIKEDFHYAFDWDLYIRYLSLFSNVRYLDELIIHFRYHDLSKTVSMAEQFQLEEWKIIEKLGFQSTDKNLQKLAINKLELKIWMPFLKSVTENLNIGKIAKMKMILRAVNKKNIVHWRAILGAIRIIILQ